MSATVTQEGNTIDIADTALQSPNLQDTDLSRHPHVDMLSGKVVSAVAEANNAGAYVSSSGSERLPVVEICPFMNQQWRPSRSLPDCDRSTTSMSTNSFSEYRGSPFPNPTMLGLLHKQRAMQEFGSRCSLNGKRPEGVKLMPREGKPVDTSHPGTYVSVNNRGKTTMKDIQDKIQGNQSFVYMQDSPRHEQINCHPIMHIEGRKVERMPPKLSMFYMTPWEYYRINGSYQIPPHRSPNGVESVRNEQSVIYEGDMQYPAMENIHIDDTIYDTFDRSNTLPSIRFTNAPIRKKYNQRQRQSTVRSTSGSSALGSSKTSVIRLGVANSLDVLRHFGQPATVETNVSMHLKHTMNQLRRTQNPKITLSGLPIQSPSVSTISSTKPIGLRSSGIPTQGEVMIRAGIEANNAKKPLVRSRDMYDNDTPDVQFTPASHAHDATNGPQTGPEGGEDGIPVGHPTMVEEIDNSKTASRRRKKKSKRAEVRTSSPSDQFNMLSLSPEPDSNNNNNIVTLDSPLSEEDNQASEVPYSSRNSTQSSHIRIKSPQHHGNPFTPRSLQETSSDLPRHHAAGLLAHAELVEEEGNLAAPNSSPTEESALSMTPSEGDVEIVRVDNDPIHIPQTSNSTPSHSESDQQDGKETQEQIGCIDKSSPDSMQSPISEEVQPGPQMEISLDSQETAHDNHLGQTDQQDLCNLNDSNSAKPLTIPTDTSNGLRSQTTQLSGSTYAVPPAELPVPAFQSIFH